ncbi:hypothetical protein [Pleomorphomonas oryzae]|uniref:hypothetical protein n=1 Tax=Pleomorphomonas oryzae TaxID=261934 RepID=UPI0004082CB3|nr:hypothetical protein [Pleomorphomonas oryzae]
MTDHICKPAMDLTFLRSGIVDALGLRGDIGRDMSNADLIAAVRKLRIAFDATSHALLEPILRDGRADVAEKAKETAR